jgi:outer membrane protein
MSPDLIYLGDRATATLYQTGPLRTYARGRLRFNSLNPDDHPEWSGLHARLWEVEAGVGAQLLTPVGIVTLRGDSDVMGRSRGQDGLLSMDFPVVRGRLAVMPSLALVWRSSNLANYYFGGVSHGEATSERPYYDVGAALSLSTSIVVSYRFNRRWLGALVSDYERYPGAIRNSPLVGKAGSYDLLVGAGYAF